MRASSNSIIAPITRTANWSRSADAKLSCACDRGDEKSMERSGWKGAGGATRRAALAAGAGGVLTLVRTAVAQSSLTEAITSRILPAPPRDDTVETLLGARVGDPFRPLEN